MTAAEYIAKVLSYGKTDQSYLNFHATRFLLTKSLFDERHAVRGSCHMLDIGAHWLHQSLLYSLSGHRVIAADVGGVLNVQSVRDLASENAISLLQLQDLSAAEVFDGIADESIDFVLFTEILEHITFNPVAMWQAIHRVLKADGKVIITTPNYYFWQSRAWDLRRFMRRMGGGIPVEDIVGEITYGHHWKEYSAREIVSYFSILPTNLHVSYMRYVSFNDAHRQLRRGWKISAGRMLEQQVGFFRDSIYAEVSRSEMTATT